MHENIQKTFALTPLCALLAAGSAYATNGYFSHGYGIKAKGMGGGLPAAVDSNLFLVPESGYNKTVNDKVSVGLTVYGNGGMNPEYPGGQINCGRGPANVLAAPGNWAWT